MLPTSMSFSVAPLTAAVRLSLLVSLGGMLSVTPLAALAQEEGVVSEKKWFPLSKGGDYRKWILEKGSSMEELDLVKKFLGREFNSKAFLKELGV